MLRISTDYKHNELCLLWMLFLWSLQVSRNILSRMRLLLSACDMCYVRRFSHQLLKPLQLCILKTWVMYPPKFVLITHDYSNIGKVQTECTVFMDEQEENQSREASQRFMLLLSLLSVFSAYHEQTAA